MDTSGIVKTIVDGTNNLAGTIMTRKSQKEENDIAFINAENERVKIIADIGNEKYGQVMSTAKTSTQKGQKEFFRNLKKGRVDIVEEFKNGNPLIGTKDAMKTIAKEILDSNPEAAKALSDAAGEAVKYIDDKTQEKILKKYPQLVRTNRSYSAELKEQAWLDLWDKELENPYDDMSRRMNFVKNMRIQEISTSGQFYMTRAIPAVIAFNPQFDKTVRKTVIQEHEHDFAYFANVASEVTGCEPEFKHFVQTDLYPAINKYYREEMLLWDFRKNTKKGVDLSFSKEKDEEKIRIKSQILKEQVMTSVGLALKTILYEAHFSVMDQKKLFRSVSPELLPFCIRHGLINSLKAFNDKVPSIDSLYKNRTIDETLEIYEKSNRTQQKYMDNQEKHRLSEKSR